MTAIIHEAANLFPLEEETIPDLAEDIRKRGLRVPIERFEGRVLDGRRRLKACAIAGVKPRFVDITTDDPIAYVLSLNLHRRQLNTSQRAMVGAAAVEMYKEQAKERQRKGGEAAGKGRPKVPVNSPEPIRKGDARDLAGKAVGVSGSTLDQATKVLRDGEPELVKAVQEGRMTVNTARNLLDEPPEEQREAAKAENPKRRSPKKPESVEVAIPRGGLGVIRAHEAIDKLKMIPKDDPQRMMGFNIVKDWIKQHS